MEQTKATGTERRPATGVLLRRLFCLTVILLALWRFSENTADPDLWGHVLFGQRMLALQALEKSEPFSWTAPDYPWVNHEVGAELILGATHLLTGGPGLLLLAMVTGMFTFLMALRLGSQGLSWPERAVAWAIGLVAAKEIAFGFSVRPQIFTAVAMVIQLLALRRIHEGKWKWALALPPLFLLWINTHGGALAGFCVFTTAVGATTVQALWEQYGRRKREDGPSTSFAAPSLLPLWLAYAGSGIALLINPWGWKLIQWLIESVSWFRPEISEWNPPRLGLEHAGMFALVLISVFAFVFSRRKRQLWEAGVVAALAFVSLRHLRHIPLFCIAALAFVPPYLADALARFREHFENLRTALARPAIRGIMAAGLVLACLSILAAAFTYRKERFYTIEVPRDEYPVSAIEFIREHEIEGNLLVFFDWGEQCIWELPKCPVSIDGRLDTCFSRELLREHWNFYDAKPVDQKIFDFNKADFTLLRMDVVGISTLKKNPAWKLVYQDPLSVVLVRDVGRFSKLEGIDLPVTRSRVALNRRDAFPSVPSKNAVPRRR